MNLKTISKFKFLFFIFLSILFTSCSERKEIISKIDNAFLEKKDSIETSNYNKTRNSLSGIFRLKLSTPTKLPQRFETLLSSTSAIKPPRSTNFAYACKKY